VDWRVDEISFSYGAKEDLPDSINSVKGLPDSAISSHVHPTLKLEGGIGLGATPRKILRQFGKPSIDTTESGYRYISYATDYRFTEDVLVYEARFCFKNNHLIRFSIYNGE
jgi:hypothetical protein